VYLEGRPRVCLGPVDAGTERRRERIVFGTDNGCGVLLMSSTPSAYPQVGWRRLASFRIMKFSIYAGQRDFCDGFDSRQLH
jgi:hypothetical protein